MEVSLHKIVYDNTLILLVGLQTFQKLASPEDFLLLLKQIEGFLPTFKNFLLAWATLGSPLPEPWQNGCFIV